MGERLDFAVARPEHEADAEPKGNHRAGADTRDARLSGMVRGTNSSTDYAPENGPNNVCSTDTINYSPLSIYTVISTPIMAHKPALMIEKRTRTTMAFSRLSTSVRVYMQT